MNSAFAGDDPFEFVSGGFAAAATESELVTPEIFANAIVPVRELGFGLIAPRKVDKSIFRSAYEKIKSYINDEGRPLTGEEFRETLTYDGLIHSLRKILRAYAQKHDMTEHELYSRTIKVIREHKAYINISDDDKEELARRLTIGLL